MSFPNPQTGWICGTWTLPYPPPYGTNYAEIRKTTNAGTNWTIQQSSPEYSYSIYRVFFTDVNTGYKNDFSTYCVSRTVNGGSSYSGLPEFGNYLNYYAMTFPSANTGWFIGAKTMKTINGGASWTEMTTPHSAAIYKGVHFINNMTGWLVGDGGIIIKTTTGGLTSNKKIFSSVPDKFALSQNYPNPFNPSTTIKFQIKESGTATLKVYDILGKEVSVLVNEKKQPGEYETMFEGFTLPSGVYFYNLTAGDFSETKKMLLIK
jgi:hypothetical protein